MFPNNNKNVELLPGLQFYNRGQSLIFNPVIPTKIFVQSHNPDGDFRHLHLRSCSLVALKSRVPVITPGSRKTSRDPLVSLQTVFTASFFSRFAALSPPVPSELLFSSPAERHTLTRVG